MSTRFASRRHRLRHRALARRLRRGRWLDDPEPPPPPPLDPQVRITGLSPFAPGCDGVIAPGTLYVNAEVEPHVAVNPVNPNHLVAAWQQDRWSNGAARGNRSAASFDGGRTWTASQATFSRCTGGTPANGGDYERASDPWVAIGPDGTAYQIAIAVSGESQTPSGSGAVLVSRSGDGGRTWEPPVTLIRDIGPAFNDKETITADWTDARYAYAIWDRLDGNFGPTVFARTIDCGPHLGAGARHLRPGPGRQTLNNQVVVLPDGTLVASFTASCSPATSSSPTALMVIRSPDKGVTWSAPIRSRRCRRAARPIRNRARAIRDGATLGSISAGRNGQIAIVWQDARFSGGQRDGIAFSRSLDGGLTWTAPVQVNRVPAVQAFLPGGPHPRRRHDRHQLLRLPQQHARAVAARRLLAAAIDRRRHLARVAHRGDVRLRHRAGRARLFLGDYMGLTSSGTTFLPVYALTNAGDLSNRTDIFVTRQSTVGAAADAGAKSTSGPPTEPLALTPELEEAFAASATRTVERRRELWYGRSPASSH